MPTKKHKNIKLWHIMLFLNNKRRLIMTPAIICIGIGIILLCGVFMSIAYEEMPLGFIIFCESVRSILTISFLRGSSRDVDIFAYLKFVVPLVFVMEVFIIVSILCGMELRRKIGRQKKKISSC